MWGSNPDCRLMIETEENSLIPAQTLMSELRKEDPDAFEVMTLSLGVTHSVVITRSGEVFSAGSKLEGQLGGNFEEPQNQEDEDFYSPLTQVLPFGDDDEPRAVKASCGDSFTLILDELNNVHSFGKGSHGRLGNGDDKNCDKA